MAIRPQLIAAAIVALVTSTGRAQQPFVPPADGAPPYSAYSPAPEMPAPNGQFANLPPAPAPAAAAPAASDPGGDIAPPSASGELVMPGQPMPGQPMPGQPMSGYSGPFDNGYGMEGGYPYGAGFGGEYGGDYCGGPCGDGLCADGCCDGPLLADGACTPGWYFRADAVWLKRDRPNNRNLTVYDNFLDDSDPKNNKFILKTDDLTFDSVAGMRLTLGKYLNANTAIEGGFYGTHDWNERRRTPVFPNNENGTGPLFPYWGTTAGVFDTTAFSNANQHIATASSSFDSAEIGIRRWLQPNTSLLAGFRYVNVGDSFQLFSFNDEDRSSENIGIYRTWTTNKLFGAQIGTEYTHQFFAPWLFFAAEAKGGIFANAAEQKNLLFISDLPANRRDAQSTQFARLVDVSVGLTALLGSHLTVRGGYSFLFINGLALAPDQLDMSPVQANSRRFIADKGSMSLYGPYFGGELAW